jgi:hypothetical protein
MAVRNGAALLQVWPPKVRAYVEAACAKGGVDVYPGCDLGAILAVRVAVGRF